MLITTINTGFRFTNLFYLFTDKIHITDSCHLWVDKAINIKEFIFSTRKSYL
jgi:hypothetical protein